MPLQYIRYMLYRAFLFLALVSSCDSNQETTVDDNTLEPMFKFEQVGTLDPSIKESSGLVTINDRLYTHNDKRGTARFLNINTTGNLKNTIGYENIDVRDWEDIAVDDTHVYLADIGNNLGNKTDLKIFKIQKTDLEASQPNAAVIEFYFNDQIIFDNNELNKTGYDAEALVAINDHLYVFTKDWINLTTTMYRVDKNAGTYALNPINTFDIGGLITGATRSAQGDIILCGYSRTLFPFLCRIGMDNEQNPTLKEKIDLTTFIGNPSQIEGISYYQTINGQAVYYLTSEEFTTSLFSSSMVFPANLYKLTWNP